MTPFFNTELLKKRRICSANSFSLGAVSYRKVEGGGGVGCRYFSIREVDSDGDVFMYALRCTDIPPCFSAIFSLSVQKYREVLLTL